MGVPDRRLSDDEVTAVFRRAAELDQVTGVEGGALDRAAVERAAVEAGLSVEAIRSALAELDAGRLQVGLPRRRRRWREASVVVERELPVPSAVAIDRISKFLRGQTMRVVRRRGGVTVWEPAEGVAATVTRGVDLSGRMRLKSVSRVIVSAAGDSLTCRVRIELDFSGARRDNLAGAITGSAVGTIAAGGGLVAAVMATELALIAVPLGGITAAAAWFGSRSGYTKQVDRALTAVELVLDELEERGLRA